MAVTTGISRCQSGQNASKLFLPSTARFEIKPESLTEALVLFFSVFEIALELSHFVRNLAFNGNLEGSGPLLPVLHRAAADS